MEKKFNVEIVSFKKIDKIEDAWSSDDYRALLLMMDMDEEDVASIQPNELKEMCLMSLNDLEHHAAAKLLLTYVFQDAITEGKIDQICHVMADDKLWEEFADPAYHKRLFDAYGLLREAYNGIFPHPTGVQFHIKITSKGKEAFELFDDSLYPALVRLLASGLGEDAILHRLYDEQISGKKFTEAESIVWILKERSRSDLEREYEIVSSELWFGELADVDSFEAETHADAGDEEEGA
ncbi:MAG: hypothetical protein PF439_04225 [Helicobacteraceae bacterium]|nr:hypothetical protein [Helicobacteraceae bacterium]